MPDISGEAVDKVNAYGGLNMKLENDPQEDGKKQETETVEKVELNAIKVKLDAESEKKNKEEVNRIGKAFALCVCYAANVGGIATLTGTPPNLVMQGIANERWEMYGAADAGITYSKWMGFGVPLSIIMLFLTWVWLQIFFLRCGCCKKQDQHKKQIVERVVRNEYKKLGSMKFGEIVVLICFVVLALLWILRDLPNTGGWGNAFTQVGDPKRSKTASDSTASIFVAVLLFVLPIELPNVFCWYKHEDEKGNSRKVGYKPILDWQTAEKKVAWGVIFLLGGGFALADATTKSGLSKLVGCALNVFMDMKPWVVNLLLSLIVAMATEITSNAATASLLMPILFELAISIGLHPLYLMISACVACSFAFMLPVATPPNAIVFSTGRVRIPDMAGAGFLMNVLAILVLQVAINTWGSALFDLDTFPAIFQNKTANDSCSNVIKTTVLPIVNLTTTSPLLNFTTTIP